MESCFYGSWDRRAAWPHGIAAGFSRKYFPFSLTTGHAHTPWFSENLTGRDWNICSTRIVSLNRIVHLNNLNRFVHAWTVLSAKVISYPTVKIRVQQKVILLENFDQKTIRFNSYCPYWKFWAKNNTVQPILSFKKILRKRQYCLIHIAFYENFIDKIMRFNPYSFVANSWSKDKTV